MGNLKLARRLLLLAVLSSTSCWKRLPGASIHGEIMCSANGLGSQIYSSVVFGRSLYMRCCTEDAQGGQQTAITADSRALSHGRCLSLRGGQSEPMMTAKNDMAYRRCVETAAHCVYMLCMWLMSPVCEISIRAAWPLCSRFDSVLKLYSLRSSRPVCENNCHGHAYHMIASKFDMRRAFHLKLMEKEDWAYQQRYTSPGRSASSSMISWVNKTDAQRRATF
jgi:hypothetical protein